MGSIFGWPVAEPLQTLAESFVNLMRDIAGAVIPQVNLQRRAHVSPELERGRCRWFSGRLLLCHPYDGNGQKFLLAMGINVLETILFTLTGLNQYQMRLPY